MKTYTLYKSTRKDKKYDVYVEKDGKIKYQIKLKHLEYYNSIPNPILFLIYSTTSDLFWGIWSNDLKDTLSKEQLSQESVNLTFYSKNIIQNTYFEDLPNNFTLDIPKKISIEYISTLSI